MVDIDIWGEDGDWSMKDLDSVILKPNYWCMMKC